MERPASSSAALPIAYIVLRTLIVVNWLYGAAIVVLLVAMSDRAMDHDRARTFSFARGRSADRRPARDRGDRPRRGPAELRRPQTAARDRRDGARGDPFVAANADRLQAIAWSLLALQLLSLVIGAIARAVSTPAHPLDLDAGFSINGWLAVLLTFLLARVFAAGALMREDLEGTV